MRDDRYYSSASMNTYIHWVLKDKLGLSEKEVRKSLEREAVEAVQELSSAVGEYPAGDWLPA